MVLQTKKTKENITNSEDWSLSHRRLKCVVTVFMLSSKGGMLMTANQIRYAELQESRRHNVASESIEARKAGASETSAGAQMANVGAQYASVAESSRHNRQMEDIGWNQYYSLAQLQSAQSAATIKDSETRRRSQESTQAHYERADAISGARAITDTVYGGVDTVRRLATSYFTGGLR